MREVGEGLDQKRMQDGDDLEVVVAALGGIAVAGLEVREHCPCELGVLLQFAAQLLVSSQQPRGRRQQPLEQLRHSSVLH